MVLNTKSGFLFRQTLLSCLFLLLITPFAYAQEKIAEEDYTVTQKELAVLAFFRLAGISPNYEQWIKNSRTYKAIPGWKEKERYLVKEALRLGRGYGMYDLAQGLLEFDVTVNSSYTPPANGKAAKFHFKFPDQPDDYIPVFVYPYGVNSIALVVNKFGKFSNIDLTPDQYEKVISLMPHDDEEYTAQLKLQVRPTRADIEKPIVSQDIYQWMMLGEIAYIRCEIIHPTTLRKVQLWDYVAPWYQKEFEEKHKGNEEKNYPHPYDLFKEKE